MPRSNRHGKLVVSGKSPADMVTEALMTELKYQLSVAHQQHMQVRSASVALI